MVRRPINARMMALETIRAAERFVAANADASSGAAGAAEDAAVAEVWDAIGLLALEREDGAVDPDSPRAPARARTPPRWWAAAAAAAAGLALVIVGSVGGRLWSERPRVYATTLGKREMVRLAEGSQIWLNGSSRAVVRIGARDRRVELQAGEALFQVTKLGATRPFFVTAGAATIRVTGTRFDVQAGRRGVEVDVVEGAVRVSREGDDTGGVELHPGDGLGYDISGAHRHRADLERVHDWPLGRVVFDRRRLGEAIEAINRDARIKLVLIEPRLADRRISGVFAAGASQSFADAVHALYGVDRVSMGDTIQLGKAKAAPHRL